MNDKFDELTKGLARFVTRCGALKKFSLAGIALTSLLAAHANDFRAGPISDLSDPDVFVECGSNGAEKECSIAVNPTNSKNLVAAWIGGRFVGIGAAVSVDGGNCLVIRLKRASLRNIAIATVGIFRQHFERDFFCGRQTNARWFHIHAY